MRENYFAIYDDNVTRLKVVKMTQISGSPNYVIRLTGITPDFSDEQIVKVGDNDDPVPELRKIPLEEGQHLYLWRSPWCIYYRNTAQWIPILDSDRRSMIPGVFFYKERTWRRGQLSDAYKGLHEQMILEIQERERPPPVPSAPPAQSPIAAYLGEIIKRDAIHTKAICSISLEEFTTETKTGITPCFHLFEAESLRTWLQTDYTCPICKSTLMLSGCLFI